MVQDRTGTGQDRTGKGQDRTGNGQDQTGRGNKKIQEIAKKGLDRGNRTEQGQTGGTAEVVQTKKGQLAWAEQGQTGRGGGRTEQEQDRTRSDKIRQWEQ